MKLHSRQYLDGPNICANYCAVRWVLEDALAPLPDASEVDKRTNQLFASVTGVQPEIVSTPSTCLAILALKYALALQRAHHHPVSKAKFRPLEQGRCELVIEVAKAGIATALCECTFALIDEVCGKAKPGTFAHIRETHALRLRFGLTHTYLHDRLKVARRLGVPAWYEGARRFMFFGDGRHARLTSGGHTDRTSVLGTQLEHDKARASRRLAACGLPAAQQKLVSNADDAVSAARHIAYPVVIKPRWGKQGQGVSVNLENDEQVRAAYASARDFNREVVVERFLAGDSYRLLSINGRFVAAIKTLPPKICGDGSQSLRMLIDIANRRERRDGVMLNPIEIDAELCHSLATRGLSLDSIPDAGDFVVLRGTANQAIGGTTVDVTNDVHPDNQEMAVAAAHACMLDIAGLDFVTTDIGRSWRDGVGGIVEVNGGPAFDLHMLPTEGKPRDVSWHLIRAVRPASSPGMALRFMIAGRYGKKSAAARLAELLSHMGITSGLLAKKMVTVNGSASEFDDEEEAAEAAFTRPDVSAVVVEQSLGALGEAGSLVERYAVTVLTDAGGDTTALEEALSDSTAGERVAKLAAWLASVTVIDAAYADLMAWVACLPPHQKGYIWVERADSEQVNAHVATGGWAVVRVQRVDGDWLEWRQGGQRVALMPVVEDGNAHIRDNAFAAAALIGAGHRPEAVAAALGGAQSVVMQAVWPADELELTFDGAWINRPGPGWRVGKVTLGVDAVIPGSVAVIAGPPNDLAACAQIEASVRSAFARGASAVVAPLVPDDLPRWRPVLVCDNPAAGYARLTESVCDSVVSLA